MSYFVNGEVTSCCGGQDKVVTIWGARCLAGNGGLSPRKKGRGDTRASDRLFPLSSLLSHCGPSLDSSSPQNTLNRHQEQVSLALHIAGLTSLVTQVACSSLMASFG